MSPPGTQWLEGTAGGRPAMALFSDDRRYRYVLWRMLAHAERHKRMVFVMLNPSDASHERDDATVRRCVGFALRERCSILAIVNAFSLVAHNPRRLLEADDPVGPCGDYAIEFTLITGPPSTVVAGWGAVADRPALRPRIEQVTRIISTLDVELHALGELTASGYPRHPLYLRADAPLRNVTHELIGR